MATITFTEKQLASLHRLVEYLVIDSEEFKDYYEREKEDRTDDHIYHNIKDVSEALDLDWSNYEWEVEDEDEEEDKELDWNVDHNVWLALNYGFSIFDGRHAKTSNEHWEMFKTWDKTPASHEKFWKAMNGLNTEQLEILDELNDK
jgi:hypothetical protein